MVRLKSSACSLTVLTVLITALLVTPVASAAVAPTVKAAPPSKGSAPVGTTLAAKPAPPKVELDWRARMAITVKELQAQDPDKLARIEQMQPSRSAGDELHFTQPELEDPRAAAVLLRRIMQSDDAIKVRCALVDALSHTGGDWQEGAAALVGIDASPKVRKKLIELMRYADAPHAVEGLKLGFKDEDPEVNIAAARTAAFSRSGPELYTELYSSTFDNDWDLRAAAVQALGMLKLPKSRDVLVKALHDEEREVRLQALLALEQLDPEGLLQMPELEELAKDRKSHRIARKAELLLRKRRIAAKAAARAERKKARALAREQASGKTSVDPAPETDLIPVVSHPGSAAPGKTAAP